jgi:hypothetical protein
MQPCSTECSILHAFIQQARREDFTCFCVCSGMTARLSTQAIFVTPILILTRIEICRNHLCWPYDLYVIHLPEFHYFGGYFYEAVYSQTIQRRMVAWQMNDEVERILKGAVWGNRCTVLEFVWRDCGKTSPRTADVPAGIWTVSLPNTNLEICLSGNPYY